MLTETLGRLARRWPSFLDAACDALLLSFAGWTVFYQLALVLQFSMLPAGWPWIVLTVLVVLGAGLRAVRDPDPAPPDLPAERSAASVPATDERVVAAGTGGTRRHRWVALAAVIVIALVAGRGIWGVWPAALVAAGVILVQLGGWVRGPRREVLADGREPSSAAHWFALGASVAFGVIGSFLLRPDADDVYYVNRATWVATHGTAALNDTMFGPNTEPSATNAGIPTPSIEAAQGVLAHALGVQAPTLCYLIAVPLLGFLVGWTTWRLIRAWAPRRWALAMAAAMLFAVASADSVVGAYSLGRIWQGKATAYTILLPLVWLLLSRTVSRIRRSDLVLLIAAGVSFVGLTTSSSLLAPVVGGAGLLAAVLLRSRSLAWGSVAFLAAPMANGILQVLAPKPIGGTDSGLTVLSDGAFAIAFGHALPMILLALAAVVLAPRSVPGAAGILLGCGALATMVGLVPGVFQLADVLTGAGPVAWRLVVTLPTWVLVGLLTTWPATEPIGNRSRWAELATRAAVPGLITLVLVIPVLFGTWLWNGAGAQLTSRPTWKVDQRALADVRAAKRLGDVPAGRWLMPPDQMQILTISTITPSSVVPRAYYLGNLEQSHQDLSDRVALFRLASGGPAPTRTVRNALEHLDVALSCVREEDQASQEILARATREELRPVGDMRCHVDPPSR